MSEGLYPIFYRRTPILDKVKGPQRVMKCLLKQDERVTRAMGIVNTGLNLKQTKREILENIDTLDRAYLRELEESGCPASMRHDTTIERLKRTVLHNPAIPQGEAIEKTTVSSTTSDEEVIFLECTKCGSEKRITSKKGIWTMEQRQSYYCPICGETVTFKVKAILR